MNILPLIFSLLIILAVASQTFLHKATTLQELSFHYLNFMSASLAAQNKLEKKFSKNQQKKNSKETSMNLLPLSTTSVSHKKPLARNALKNILKSKTASNLTSATMETNNPSSMDQAASIKKPKHPVKNSCLNLYPLFKEGKEKQKTLFAVFKKLLHELYLSTTLFPHDEKNVQVIDHLASVMIESVSANILDENFSLETLALQDPSLHPLFYKMLKGTKHYNPEHQIGYPSLLDFVTVKKTGTISIVFAPFQTLSALFSPSIAEKIQKHQEKTQFFPISKEVFETLAQQDHISLSPELYKLFNFTKTPYSEKKTQVHFQDKKTGIKIRKAGC